MLTDLPPEWLAVAGAFLLSGLLLLAFGKRLLRPALVVAGACIGAGVGFALAVAMKVGVSEWIVAGAAAFLFGLFSWLAYRPAMGVFMAILLGSASPIAVIAWAEYRGHHIVSEDPDDAGAERDLTGAAPEGSDRERLVAEMRELLHRLRRADDLPRESRALLREEWHRGRVNLGLEAEDSSAGVEGESADDTAAPPPWREQFDLLVEHLRTEFNARWEAADPGVRRSIVLSAASGAILGLLTGLTFPGIAAAVLTAMVGAATVLISGWSIIGALGHGESAWVPQSTGLWVILWAVISIAGMAIQWTIRSKPADKAG